MRTSWVLVSPSRPILSSTNSNSPNSIVLQIPAKNIVRSFDEDERLAMLSENADMPCSAFKSTLLAKQRENQLLKELIKVEFQVLVYLLSSGMEIAPVRL